VTPPELRRIGYTRRRAAVEGKVEVLDADAVVHDAAGIRFDARFGRASVTVQAPVFGEFNVENLLGSLAVLLGLGCGLADAARRLARVKPVPGRMERFSGPHGPTVVVDYAHTPDALEKALASLRPHCAGALWVVFGCGGNRDRGKRAQMGAVADRLADAIVLTDDNPRDEDGDVIIGEVLQGCRGAAVEVIRDRRHAIAHAVGRAGPADVVLVAGKGHETTQEVKGLLTPFNDCDVVCQLLAATGGRS
jgi:UDP-N-acetylmuramoyl-L-alanyl-D-glutamate--2,6-diaminopimelate ligase